MALNLYNSLTRSIEHFKPISEDSVGLYTCGPTVYNVPTIGNYRAYIFADFLKRTLLYHNFKVKHIMNITDIDDKTIRDSRKAGKNLIEFTEFYTEEFYKDRDMLNISPATRYTKATDYINEMVKIIRTLIDKGFAYQSEDGSVYFDIAKDKEYGKLSHLKIEDLKSNASGRIKSDEYEKDNIQDFALWKSWDEADGDVFWETSLGKGRPGWHIECSAMSIENLGAHFDIHTGGRDNMFPHHENEIAQSECSTGETFVNYWMHNEWLLVDGKKMAKSAGNFFTLRDLIDRNYDPLAFRYLMLLTHYRTPLNFTFDSLDAASHAYAKLKRHMHDLDLYEGAVNEKYKGWFGNAIEDDLNMPKALGVVWELVKDELISHGDKKATLLDFDKVLGLSLDKIIHDEIPIEVEQLLIKREDARAKKDFEESDYIRKQIEDKGYEVLDNKDGYQVRKK